MQQKKIFTGGLNTDTSDEFLPEGQDRYRLNVRVFSSITGNTGAVETVNGTVLVNFTLPAGDNRVVGSKEYVVKRKIYYFVYNSNQAHSILEYDAILNTVSYVLGGDFLNFNINFLITGIDIIALDENNDLLYWTDFNEEPKKVNIQKGKFHMVGNYVNGYAFPFNPENIFRIKQPHLLAPVVAYADDEDYHFNRLTDKLFQFKVQYVYDDNEISSWGPISRTPYPLSTDTIGKNNKILVTVTTGIGIVKRIRIAARVNTSANYFLVAELDKKELNISSDSTYVYDFYNDGNYPILNINESIKLFDLVPKKSKAQSIIRGNRMSDGNIVEGFDPVPVDMELGFELSSVTSGFYVNSVRINHNGLYNFRNRSPIVIITGDGTGATAEVTGMVVGNFRVRDEGFGHVGSTQLTFIGGGGSGASAHCDFDGLGRVDDVILDTAGSGYTSSPYIEMQGSSISEASIDALMAITQITITNGGSGYTTASVSIDNYDYYTELIETSVSLSGDKIIPINSLKRGGGYIYGIIYYDHANRSGATNINPGTYNIIQPNGKLGTHLFIPFYTESNPLGAAQLSFDMEVDGINVQNGGSGYTGATTLTFTGGAPSINATATPIIGAGELTELTLSNIGAGYTPDGTYTVSLTGGSGSGATAYIDIVSGAVDDVQIANAGTGYLSGDVLSVSTVGAVPALGGPTTVATFTATSDYQKIIGANITNPGAGYTSMPTVIVADSGGGTGAIVAPTMRVDTVSIVSGSSGYTSAPIATFIGGAPQVKATVTTGISSGVVNSVTLTNQGSGYLSFPTLKVEGRVYGGSYPTVDWKIYNEPPSWATHYQIARSLNTVSSRYLQFAINAIEYLDRSGNIKSYGDASVNQIRISLANLPMFQTENPGTIIAYDFVKGDRVRFISPPGAKPYDEYYDYEIGYYTTGTQSIGIKFPPGTYPNVPNFQAGTLIEIYQPKLSVAETETIVYEIATGYDIEFDVASGKYYHEGPGDDQSYWNFTAASNSGGFVRLTNPSFAHGVSAGDRIRIQQDSGFTNAAYNTYATVTSVVNANTIDTNLPYGSPPPFQSGVVTVPAAGIFEAGDTFYKNRAMAYSSGGNYETVLVEDANYSDLYSSMSYDYGRPNRIDPQAMEIHRPSTIYYGEKFIPETNINGLSTVYDTSFETYDIGNGSIQKLLYEGQGLLMFQEHKIANIPVEQNVFSGTDGGLVVGTSTKVLSSVAIYYMGEWGISTHPASFAINGKAKYGIDVNKGVVWRLSTDGLTPISKIYFMDRYFTAKCKDALADPGSSFLGTFDLDYNEYIIYSEVSGVGEAVAFNEKENMWSTFYSYMPEYFCTNGTGIVSFKNGAIWLHDQNSIQNRFHDTSGFSFLGVMVNSLPSNIKVLRAVSLESDAIWPLNSGTSPYGQETVLSVDDFQYKEGFYYAPFWRDMLTPNVANPLFEGDVMRGQTFYLLFRYAALTKSRVFAINVDFIPSNLHNKE